MNHCEYIFQLGAKKGTTCNNSCRGSLCGKHTEKAMTKAKDSCRLKRESPEQLEKERQYIINKRKDPIYKEKEFQHLRDYCEKNNIESADLWLEINNKNNK